MNGHYLVDDRQINFDRQIDNQMDIKIDRQIDRYKSIVMPLRDSGYKGEAGEGAIIDK